MSIHFFLHSSQPLSSSLVEENEKEEKNATVVMKQGFIETTPICLVTGKQNKLTKVENNLTV